MTTIVANRECMAADRRVTHGQTRFGSPKIRKFGKTIVGCAGDVDATMQFFEWWPTQAKKKVARPKIKGDMEALVLTPAGLFHYDKAGYAQEITDGFYAIGTGGMVALGAMHCGKTPAEAVAIASLVDNATGGPIDVLEL